MRIQDTNKIMKEAQLSRHDGQYSPRTSTTDRGWMTLIRRVMPDRNDMRKFVADRRVRAAAGAVGMLLISAVRASMRPKRKTGWRALMAKVS